MTDRLTIRRPDDWHLHFRDGDIMREVVPYTCLLYTSDAADDM
jgi:dihydroorotase